MAASNAQIVSFMELFGRLAVAECNRRIAAGKGFILPSVCMAQSALETGWGTAGIMTKANAFFGVKAGGSWTGKVYSASTWEVVNGVEFNTVANFRAYDSPADSMADYYELTCSLSRYANAVSYGTDRSQWKTAKETVTALHAGGYATDELYVQKIMNTINGRDLTSFDKLVTGTGDVSISPNIVYSIDDLDNYPLMIRDKGLPGATIVNDGIISYTTLAVDWDKAKTVENEGDVTIAGIPTGATMTLYAQDGDQLIELEIEGNGSEIRLPVGAKIGFNLKFNKTVKPSDYKSIGIVFSYGMPPGVETFTGVIAYFVKIE